MIIFIKGLADKELINSDVLQPLLSYKKIQRKM